ncbi:carbon-nitrogen hydrolase [Xylogone sp. PMI_703]|nr:carbon-nitrogen hydrolase [Xylogone sp. PMI_703]
MPSVLRLAVAQSHTLSTTAATLAALEQTVQRAARQSVDLVLFPEAYFGGYPRTATFGAAVGAREEFGREQFLHYFNDAVDLGDTPDGAGLKWVRKELEVGANGIRGDGTREELERIAKETGVFIVTGLVERCAGTLYCAVVYVCPKLGVIGKRRKVMPTGTERLIWGQGQPSSLRAVTTTIRGVKLTMAAAICWENYMPLLRQSLYSQNVNLYLAPTADGRDTWLPLMRTVASEGRCVVLSANQCMTKDDLPQWISKYSKESKPTQSSSVSGDNILRSSESPKLTSPERHQPLSNQGSRRRSIIIEDGNEVALPDISRYSKHQEDGSTHSIAAIEEDDNNHHQSNGPPKILPSRRKSVTTDDGNEIALPGSKDGSSTTKHSSATNGAANTSEFVTKGGSSIISPLGEVKAGPLWEDRNGLLVVDMDFDDCIRGRLDLDVAGSYSRNDSFKLTVEGLDLTPPP